MKNETITIKASAAELAAVAELARQMGAATRSDAIRAILTAAAALHGIPPFTPGRRGRPRKIAA